MKIIFAGTPTFAAYALEALIVAGHEIALVLTQPDRPAGRGMKLNVSAVKLLAKKHELALLQPHSLNQPGIHSQLTTIGVDVMVVAAYGLILPTTVLSIPRLGCLNIHASLLPHWRGAAPIQRAILAGERETGITIMQMDQCLDTGAILMQQSIPIVHNDTTKTLCDKLTILGAHCIVEVLKLLSNEKLIATPQNETNASYAPKLKKKEADINWRLSAEKISRCVRAFNPHPGAHSKIHGFSLKIFQTRVTASTTGNPGEILSTGQEGIAVACGTGTLVLEVVQKPGGQKLGAMQFLSGYSLEPGDRFTVPE